jgi:PIN domain nuclease of toxin-antitoxin system
VRILLDTHVLIWWEEDARLSRAARQAIEAADQVYVSAVSGWEISLKASLGWLRPSRTVGQAVADSHFEELPLRLRHTEALAALPWHHRDPFDRMIIAQAMTERLAVVTRDRAFAKYGVGLINA